MKRFELVDVIHRSLENNIEDVEPLVKYLGMDANVLRFSKGDGRNVATKIANHLRKMGSNDLATLARGGEGVPYDEIVFNVGEKLKAKVSEKYAVEKNEEQILLKLFEESLERMTDDEKRAALRSIGIDEKNIPLGGITAFALQNALREFGGFYIYRITVMVANMVAKAILGSGLSLATNAAITRALGAFLGPVGWIASGVWIAVDLAGPAFRKTVPAVIHVALLRTILTSRITIGVVGDGSSGKDALLHAVFGIESAIDPVAGSTDEAMIYPLTRKGNAHIVNYPGFNDYRTKVNEQTDDYLFHTDVFVMVVDINRGISGTDLKILERLKSFGKPMLICLNKVDLPRTEDDLAKLRVAAQSRLNGYPIVETAFDPDPRLPTPRVGCKEVYDWIRAKVESDGKGVDAESFPPFKGR